MAIIHLDNLDDRRLAPYRNLKDRELARQGDCFIAEGHHVALRLLASDFPVESVLVMRKREEMMRPHVPDDVPLYVLPDEQVQHVVGYKFHSGVLAIGRRRPGPTLDEVMLSVVEERRSVTLVVCPETRNAENLGLLVRIAAGFGVDAMLLGPQCTDPFWRRTIRVSMGSVFRLPMVRSTDLADDLRRLRQQWGVHCLATVLDESARPLREVSRPRPPQPDRLALLFGSEDQGLGEPWTRQCDQCVTIPMQWGTDSLNVAAAAAVFLYHFQMHESRA